MIRCMLICPIAIEMTLDWLTTQFIHTDCGSARGGTFAICDSPQRRASRSLIGRIGWGIYADRRGDCPRAGGIWQGKSDGLISQARVDVWGVLPDSLEILAIDF